MKFDQDFEEEILSKVLEDTNYLKRASRILEAHHFNSKQFSWVWETANGIWKKYRERATPRLMLARARVEFRKDEERAPYLKLIQKLYRRKTNASKATLDELSTFVKAIDAQIAMETAAELLEKGKIEAVYNELKKLSRKELQQLDYTEIKWIEEFDERQGERKRIKEHPEEIVVIPTGFKRLDGIIKGIQLGELGLILATTGKGKSILLTNLAYHAIRRGFSVVYFALEMPARQIATRQDARWLGINYRKFKEYDFAPSELRAIQRRLKRVRKKWKDKLRIISMPLKRCDIDKIRGTLDDMQDDGFRPQLILVDSGDHMNSVGKYESYRLSQASVYWDLKTLAEDEGYAVWSSTHAGKEWAKAVATAEASGESYDKSKIADIVCSINTPERKSRSTKIVLEDEGDGEEEEEVKAAVGDYAELYLAKYRDGPSRITIPMDTDFSKIFITEIE